MSRSEYVPNPPPQSLTDQSAKDLALYLQNELAQIVSFVGGLSEEGSDLATSVDTLTESVDARAATAWGSFDSTPTIKDSYNIASVVKDSLGRYTITFSTPMSNANYCVVPAGGGSSAIASSVAVHTFTTTSFQFNAYSQAGTLTAWPYNGFSVYGGV